METQDLRYLLPTKKLIEYDPKVLFKAWESIMKEYEQLTKRSIYSAQIRKETSDTKKENRLNGLISCYYLIKYCNKQGIEDSKYWKIDINDFSSTSLNKIGTSILQEQTRLNIDKEKKKSIQLAQNKNVIPKYDKMLIMVENTLNRNLKDDLTVSQWVYLLESIEERNKSLEAINNKKHGRENNIK